VKDFRHRRQERPPMDRKLATQFQQMRIQVNEPRPAFDMHIAVWLFPGRGECVIGAPSIGSLAERWFEITRMPLDTRRAQHVVVIHCDAPEELMNAAKDIAGGNVRIAD
jgi:hypothetical protein